jgi:hypothetical protein
VDGQRHAPAALPSGKTRYPLYRTLGGPQGRSGQVRKISPPTGIRSPDLLPSILYKKGSLNLLNTELNPICHLLVLFGDLTFMGPCIVSIFQYTCISNKMQRYTVYLYLETSPHVVDLVGDIYIYIYIYIYWNTISSPFSPH